ncbi:fungal specific transcription factor [Botrytis cinerea]
MGILATRLQRLYTAWSNDYMAEGWQKIWIQAGRFCDYSYLSQVESSHAVNDLRSRVDELGHRILQLCSPTSLSHVVTDLPASSATLGDQNYHDLYMQAFYLDSEVWSSFDFTRQPSSVILSAEVLAYLDDVDETKRKYFSSTHTWMPIISKMRLNRLTDSAVGKTRVDIALLLLCMKLVPDGVAEDENKPSDLYLTAKQLCATLERNCLLTLRSLQANLLLAVYEVGHAIYPAAALTVGCCMRQGVALGLHNKDAPQLGVMSAAGWIGKSDSVDDG